MKSMTPREKLMATLRCEDIKEIPISPLGINRFEWTNDFPSYRKVIDALTRFGTPLVKIGIDAKPFMCDPLDTQYKQEKKIENGIEMVRSTIHTPKGELTAISQRDPKISGSSAHVKFRIENEEDVEKMLSLEKCRTFLPDVSAVLAKQKEVGEEGLCCINGLYSPFLPTANEFKYEYFLEYAFTHKEVIHEIVKVNERRLETLIQYLLEKGVGPVFRWYNIEGYTSPMMPPSFASEYMVPSDTRLMRLIKQAGGFIDNHCHGHLREQTDNFLKMGVNCINCVEPPPANDIDLKELRAKTDGKICFWGYIQWDELERKNEQEVRALTREALAMAGGKGFILSQAASAYSSDISDNFSNNLIAMIDEGVKYNADLKG